MTNNKFLPHKLGGPLCLIITVALLSCEKVPDFCAKGEWYNPETQFCFADKAYLLCNGEKYNPFTEGCDPNRNAVGTRCTDTTFVPIGTPCTGYTLSTGTAPANGGAVTRVPDLPSYIADAQVIVTAEADSGYTFAGWAGTETSTSPTITLTMDSNKPLVAMFSPASDPNAAEYALITAAFPEYGGNITRSPNAAIYNAGTEVTVTAAPENGYTFNGWSGASTSASPTITITMDGGKTLVAMFTPESGEPLHILGAWREITPATCYHPGEQTRLCSCGHTQTAAIPQLPADNPVCQNHTHTWIESIVNATCDAPGLRTQSCDCGESVTETIPQLTGTQCGRDIVYGTLTDTRDWQTYRTVEIGTQVWMAENLNYDAPGSVCYENDPSYCDIYGRLYDWTTVMDGASSSTSSPSGVQGVCPVGWHVPSDDEWTMLTDAVGGSSTAGSRLKSQTGWIEYSGISSTDDYGFSALPGGHGGNYFINAGDSGYWWSAAEFGADFARYRVMYYFSDGVNRNYMLKAGPFSLRCVEDNSEPHTHQWSEWTPVTQATCTAPGLERRTCLTDNSHIVTRAVPQLTGAECGGDIVYGTLTDTRDWQTYRTVEIGTQVWMAENLNYDAPGSACYEDDPSYCDIYGRLYGWATVMDGASSSTSSPSGVQGVCPVGWHVPSDDEWTMLTDAVGGASTAGTKLKSTSGWCSGGNGTDEYGFSALPGGSRLTNGIFFLAGYGGFWWSATEGDASSAGFRTMGCNIDLVNMDDFDKSYLYSVRCVRDSAAPQ